MEKFNDPSNPRWQEKLSHAALNKTWRLTVLKTKEYMNVMIDGVRYVPELAQSIDKGLLAALEVRFSSDAGHDLSVREYLRMLLASVWEEGECFSGKRPFGNSDWEYDIYDALAGAGFLPGALDKYGHQTITDKQQAHDYVRDLILAMCHGQAIRQD